MNVPVYSFRIDKDAYAAVLRWEGGRLVMVELLNEDDDSPPVPWRDYVKEHSEWGESVREAVEAMRGEMK